MGALLLKKTCLLFLIISASILSTSFAGGRQSRFVNNSEKELGATDQKEEVYHDEALYEIHERLLRVNTKDYRRYDPAPALVKPPFKLIPN